MTSKKSGGFKWAMGFAAAGLIAAGVAAASRMTGVRQPSPEPEVTVQAPPQEAAPVASKKAAGRPAQARAPKAAAAKTPGAPAPDSDAAAATVPTAAAKAPAAAAVKAPPQEIDVVEIIGCLERDDETFKLTDTQGSEAPKSRSWKSGFLKKRSATIEIIDSANRLRLASHVGEQVRVTGVLTEREMQGRSIQRLAESCD
jgi:hypothetical protein